MVHHIINLQIGLLKLFKSLTLSVHTGHLVVQLSQRCQLADRMGTTDLQVVWLREAT